MVTDTGASLDARLPNASNPSAGVENLARSESASSTRRGTKAFRTALSISGLGECLVRKQGLDHWLRDSRPIQLPIVLDHHLE